MTDIMKIAKSLEESGLLIKGEESGLLIKGVSETIKNEARGGSLCIY